VSSGGGSRAAPTVLLDLVGNASPLNLYSCGSNFCWCQLCSGQLVGCALVRWEVPRGRYSSADQAERMRNGFARNQSKINLAPHAKEASRAAPERAQKTKSKDRRS